MTNAIKQSKPNGGKAMTYEMKAVEMRTSGGEWVSTEDYIECTYCWVVINLDKAHTGTIKLVTPTVCPSCGQVCWPN
jgi:hypothetical protein